MSKRKKIVAAALRCNASELAISCGPAVEHDQIIEALADMMKMSFDMMDSKVERGFLTNRGKWVCRRTALKIARKAEQDIMWQEGDDHTLLHSHNLWPQLYRNAMR
jgi:hypothetical protein